MTTIKRIDPDRAAEMFPQRFKHVLSQELHVLQRKRRGDVGYLAGASGCFQIGDMVTDFIVHFAN